MPRTRTYGLDIDTIRYAQRVKSGSGATILPVPLKQINKFVIGVKKLGLWNSMVCWPMRGIHNAGTGSTVYSLGGLGVYNGTMVNSPTWGINGITCIENGPGSFGPDSTQHITSLFFFQQPIRGALIVTNPVYDTLTDGRFFSPTSLSLDGYAGSNAYRALFGTTTTFGNGQRIGGTWDLAGFGTGGQNWFGCNETYTQTGTTASANQTVGFYPVGEVNNAAIATSAFTIVFDGLQMSGSFYQLLRELYKRTLGIGLNLP